MKISLPFQKLPALLALLLLMSPFTATAEHKPMFCSDGSGTIRFFWTPHPDYSPASGWQLERVEDKSVVASWEPEQRTPALAKVAPAKAGSIAGFLKKLETTTSKEEREMAIGLLSLAAAMDFDMAEALGLGCSFNAPPGPYRYRLIETGNGSTGAELWTSPTVDSKVTSPLPSPPKLFSGESTPDGVSLFWVPASNDKAVAVGLLLERKEPDGTWQNLAGDPGATILISDTSKSGYRDAKAPIEAEVTYRIAAVDTFGRKSTFTATRVFHEDHQALQPPDMLSAEVGTGRVKLSWHRHLNPFTAGYVLERKIAGAGIFKPITPKGLPVATTSFTDRDVVGGRNYAYRIRAIGPRGKIGPASSSIIETPKAKGPPPPPKDLVARVTPIKVVLAWKPPEKAYVLRYVLERCVAGEDTWMRITPSHHAVTSYEDYFPLDTVGAYRYRVRSVGADAQRSKPSTEVEVTLTGKPNVAPPYLYHIDGSDGKVAIAFKPGDAARPPEHYLLVRGNTPEDQGLVIGAPIKGSKTSFTDTMVRPGEDYWYGLIAVDENGTRSMLSDKLLVRVSPGKIPQPEKPDCEFEEKPFRRVVITIDAPPRFLKAVVLRKTEKETRWSTLADNVGSGSEIIDSSPPRSGNVSYAVMYKTDNNITGAVSEPTSVSTE